MACHKTELLEKGECGPRAEKLHANFPGEESSTPEKISFGGFSRKRALLRNDALSGAHLHVDLVFVVDGWGGRFELGSEAAPGQGFIPRRRRRKPRSQEARP